MTDKTYKIEFEIRTSKHDGRTVYSVCENGLSLQDYPTHGQAYRYLRKLVAA